MKNRSRMKNGIRAVLVAATVAGCGAPGGDVAASPTEGATASQRHTGQELFRGILLGEGSVAEALPEIWGRAGQGDVAGTPKESAAQVAARLTEEADRIERRSEGESVVRRLRARAEGLRAAGNAAAVTAAPTRTMVNDALVAEIDETSPGFFAAFKAGVESGDPVQVSAQLNEAGERLRATPLRVDSIRPDGTFVIESWVVIETDQFIVHSRSIGTSVAPDGIRSTGNDAAVKIISDRFARG
jgi:hypothetical protein